MIALATVDRSLVSSVNIHRRQMSNLRNTYCAIAFICILSFLIWFEVFFCFDANLIGTPIQCYTTSNSCRMYNDLTHAIFIIIAPAMTMLIFGFCTIRNIRQHRRIGPNSTTEQTVSRSRRSESSLTRMLLVQVLVLTVLSLPFAIIILYLSWTFYQQKPPMQRILEGFLFNIFLLMGFIPNCISFWLYTLSGSLFRQTFIDLIKKMLRHLPCYH